MEDRPRPHDLPASPARMHPGALVISLDLELLWGVRDKRTVASYGTNIRGVREALPRMLACFDRHGVKATFATVGLLFFHDKETLVAGLPALKPTYVHEQLSPFNGHFGQVGTNEQTDPYHFGASLIQCIRAHPCHEVGCHTFSHYYCLEEGQTAAQFAADLDAATRAASTMGIQLRSLVFPRNQYNPEYLAICGQYGVEAYRGNEDTWLQQARNGDRESLLRRALRLVDAWVNLTGQHVHPWPDASPGLPVNVPASRFLRPWNRRTRAFEALRLRRITKAMDQAARSGKLYHLWWHPHNFGRNLEANMAFLEKVLLHYARLHREHGMESFTMAEVATRTRSTADGH